MDEPDDARNGHHVSRQRQTGDPLQSVRPEARHDLRIAFVEPDVGGLCGEAEALLARAYDRLDVRADAEDAGDAAALVADRSQRDVEPRRDERLRPADA